MGTVGAQLGHERVKLSEKNLFSEKLGFKIEIRVSFSILIVIVFPTLNVEEKMVELQVEYRRVNFFSYNFFP